MKHDVVLVVSLWSKLPDRAAGRSPRRHDAGSHHDGTTREVTTTARRGRSPRRHDVGGHHDGTTREVT
ncbi:MAG: hypothetical protein P8020_21270, partial [Acidobacteriota bacterium]